jgi:hypothetical protein
VACEIYGSLRVTLEELLGGLWPGIGDTLRKTQICTRQRRAARAEPVLSGVHGRLLISQHSIFPARPLRRSLPDTILDLLTIMRSMVDFTMPAETSCLQFCISRKPPHTYRLMFARAYGMAVSREVLELNPSTPIDAPPALSPRGRPLVWIEEDGGHQSFRQGYAAALARADYPIVARTGRTRRVRRYSGGEVEAVEVEILLDEDQLSRGCRHCDDTELEHQPGPRPARVGGKGYASVYCCVQVRSCLHVGDVSPELLTLPQCSTIVTSFRRTVLGVFSASS